MAECSFILSPVMPSAAERHVQRLDIQDIDGAPDFPLHDAHIFVREDFRLDVGEAPPGLAALGIVLDHVSVSGDRFVRSPGEAQAMAVGDPMLCLSTGSATTLRYASIESSVRPNRSRIEARVALKERSSKIFSSCVKAASASLSRSCLNNVIARHSLHIEGVGPEGDRSPKKLLGLDEGACLHRDFAKQRQAARFVAVLPQMLE